MPSHIRKLISEGEHQQLDFKFGITDSKKIARSLAAFANTDGGRLLLGVKDNGAIAGVRSDEEFYMVEAGASLYCRPEVHFEMKEWEENGKTVLEIIIPKSGNAPHSAPDKDGEYRVYVRVGDQNFPANGVLKKVWKKQKDPKGVYIEYGVIERTLLAYLEVHQKITLSAFRRISGYSLPRCEHILADFIILNIIKMNYSESGVFYTLNPDFRLE
ncbi:protein containing divergent AAA domain [Lentimicrobium saccharophilum]|uniref:Protein containing divergent AAA domain n=1 Tax=Lentimicrobium saccharophilum TaxID=1678841 RepID=A0A0S7C2C5_9BACT|nr:ATP-binding protein [Lentimicrobium saccharophilum]GAP44302.1 protein containing divergent AAA domain [Lentimicrobium saccharophilum]